MSLDNLLNIILGFISVNILHFHWIENFFRSKRKPLYILRFLIFLFCLQIIKFFLKKKIIVTLHNVLPHEILDKRLDIIGFSMILKIADIVIVHNKFSYTSCINFYKILPSKVYVIPHGNFIKYYLDKISKEDARRLLQIRNDSFVILFFGHIRRYKGLERILPILEELLNNYPNLVVLLAGNCRDSLLKQELISLAQRFKNRILLHIGYIPDKYVQVYMGAADIGVIPYKRIWTPGSLLLFMSFSKPVIIPRLPAVVEVIGKEYELYFDPYEDRQLKHSIERAITLHSNNSLRKVGLHLYAKVLEYKWEDIAFQTRRLYEKVIYHA